MCPEKPPPRWLSGKSAQQDTVYHTTCGGGGSVHMHAHVHSFSKALPSSYLIWKLFQEPGASSEHNTDPLLS